MTTYHVFGDTGGHYRQLREGLIEIGWNPETAKLPEDVMVVHCGDLLHKGPSTPAVIYMVDRIMSTNPGQWIQLAGNHELQYLGGPAFWMEDVPADVIGIVQDWFHQGQILFAYGLHAGMKLHNLSLSARGYETPNKPVLFTHSGMMKPFWQEILKEETDIVNAVNKLNALPVKVFATPGTMLGGPSYHPQKPVGPAWALSTDELWASWQNSENVPFIQVHGHTTPFDYDRNSWWYSPKEFKKNSKINPDRRTTTTKVGDSVHIAIDPGYSKTAPKGPQPALKITKEVG